VTRHFLALVLAQAAHSVEEYMGRLWEVFPPARLVTGLVSSDLERGFLVINAALVGFGFWCYFRPVRNGWHAARALMWGWVALELVNGVGHPLWAIRTGGYTPGLVTAPALLVLALALARRLRRTA
jgi:hypothetical protein